jgi:large-conductance mechanosensitive channel
MVLDSGKGIRDDLDWAFILNAINFCMNSFSIFVIVLFSNKVPNLHLT